MINTSTVQTKKSSALVANKETPMYRQISQVSNNQQKHFKIKTDKRHNITQTHFFYASSMLSITLHYKCRPEKEKKKLYLKLGHSSLDKSMLC